MTAHSPYSAPRAEDTAGAAAQSGEVASSRAKFLALTAALLGWMFDGAEMGLFSMVGRSAVNDLLTGADGVAPVESVTGHWFGVVTAGFLVGAATGGVLFGWLGDRIGRVRAMTLSVFTYAVFTGLCGIAAQAWHVGVLRFIAALGMGGEWSLGVALVMEVWPNRSRAYMAGLIGAAANVGYLLIGLIGLWLASLLPGIEQSLLSMGVSEAMAATLVANKGWRILMILGAAPALLTFFIRMFVPESRKWEEERQSGVTRSWASSDLWAVIVGMLGPAAIIYLWTSSKFDWQVRLGGTAVGLIVTTVGYTYPVVKFLRRQRYWDQADRPAAVLVRMLLAAGLAGVALLGTWGSTQWAPTWADQLTSSNVNLHAREHTQIWLAIGAIVGTIVGALMGDRLGRRPTYCLLCIFSLASVLVLFQNREYGTRLLLGAFLAGACTASFYGWLPLYLPELFRTSVRATGQGFSFNFGRILAAVGALQTGQLMGMFSESKTVGWEPLSLTFQAGYPLACSSMCLVYLVGVVLIWLAPETRGRPLPD